MKHFKTIIAVISFILSTAFLGAQDKAGIECSKINDHLYKCTITTTFSVNIVASIGPDGILLVDNGLEKTSQQLQSKLDELSHGKGDVTFIINTHFHPDHLGGNKLYAGQAVIIGHKNIRKQLTTGINILQEFPVTALPQISFDDRLSLFFNGEEIELIAFPGGHTNNDIVVYFPKSKIVYLGGAVLSDRFPYIGPRDGGHFSNYADIVQKIIKEFPADVTFITGHGRDLSMQDLKAYHQMIIETSDIVKKALAGGRSMEAIQKENILNKWESWGTSFVTTNIWIQTIADSVSGKKPQLKESIAIPLYYTLQKQDARAAVEQYHQLKKTRGGDYDFGEFNLNALGYYLLGKNRVDDAVAIFTLNVKMFPKAFNVYDSLGEAYMIKGEKEHAIRNYEKSIEINPDNRNGIDKLKELEK